MLGQRGGWAERCDLGCTAGLWRGRGGGERVRACWRDVGLEGGKADGEPEPAAAARAAAAAARAGAARNQDAVGRGGGRRRYLARGLVLTA